MNGITMPPDQAPNGLQEEGAGMKKIVIASSLALVLIGLAVFVFILIRHRASTTAPDAPASITSSATSQPPPSGSPTGAALGDGTAAGILPPAKDSPPTPAPDAFIDTDGDGLYDYEEMTLGTDPKKADTDGDTLTDGDEVSIYCTDPKKTATHAGQPDADWVRSQVAAASAKGQRAQFCVN